MLIEICLINAMEPLDMTICVGSNVGKLCRPTILNYNLLWQS